MSRRTLSIAALGIAAFLAAAGFRCQRAAAYYSNGHWTSTATEPTAPPLGSPLTLTWSIVPDGTFMPNVYQGQDRNSNFVSKLDAYIGGGTGSLEERPWFTYIEQSFHRWEEVSGVRLVYEPNDDGVTLGDFAGVTGVRGDIRLGGSIIDNEGNIYGQTGYLPNGDITLDTSEMARFSDSTDDYDGLRQTLMHEIGHALGLGHNEALGAFVLMNPFAQTLFDGPQFDDIRGAHYLYGDAYEKQTPGGNNTPATATPLGQIAVGSVVHLGVDVPDHTYALPPTTDDFASISSGTDVDYWSFALDDFASLDIELSPGGFLYQERPANQSNFSPINTRAQNDLSLALFALQDGVAELVDLANLAGLGMAESLAGVRLPAGDYAVRVSGNTDAVQLYELSIAVAADPAISTIAGDFNEDGLVDLGDYTYWRDRLGSASPLPNAPATPDIVDAADYGTWKANFGATSAGATSVAIPEPSAKVAAWLWLAAGGGLWRLAARREKSGI